MNYKNTFQLLKAIAKSQQPSTQQAQSWLPLSRCVIVYSDNDNAGCWQFCLLYMCKVRDQMSRAAQRLNSNYCVTRQTLDVMKPGYNAT